MIYYRLDKNWFLRNGDHKDVFQLVYVNHSTNKMIRVSYDYLIPILRRQFVLNVRKASYVELPIGLQQFIQEE